MFAYNPPLRQLYFEPLQYRQPMFELNLPPRNVVLKGEFKNGMKYEYTLQNEYNKNTPSIKGDGFDAFHCVSDLLYFSVVDDADYGHQRGRRVLTGKNALQVKDEIDFMFTNAWWLSAIAYVWEQKTDTSAHIIQRVAVFFTPVPYEDKRVQVLA